jgi:type I restriction enzyme S subunit
MLVHIEDEITEAGEGCGGQTELNRRVLAERFSVSYPTSVSEQQRIVGKLDTAFAALAEAQAHVKRNRANARELFESYLNGVFEGKGVGWQEMAMEELADDSCTLSYGIVQPGEEEENGLPIVRPVDLNRKVITLDGLKRIDSTLAKGYKRTELRGGELLLCVRGSTGVVSIASAELVGANVTRGIVPIRFKPIIKPAFGYYLMTSPVVQGQIREKTYGTALMQINIGDLRKVRLAFPSPKEQGRISKELDALDADTKKLEATYQQKLTELEGLKKAVLGAAFRGSL